MSFRRIRERDAQGVLVATGCEWTEAKDAPGIPLYLLTSAGVVAALLGLWVALVGDVIVGLPMVAGGAVLAWGSDRARRAYGETRRMLVFRADDTVTTRDGALPLKVSDIANIDYRLEYETPYIVLVARDGRRIDVIGNRGLEDDEARLIYDGLIDALQELRG